ncbi:MAG: response regulator [Desulfobacteraceae bacterium]|nr:MAG: response regulator [Desulfobacteraceae bacterium]
MTETSIEQSFSILVVDDEPKNVQLLGNLLEENHYDIEFALNGPDCLEWLDNRPFDLVLLDIMMPGMTGYEVCETIKSDMAKQHIPVIFLTAKSETEDIVKGFDAGASDYITKPFKAPELLARVKKEVELKILRGLIPICANCKDVRDDEGAWGQIEAYIQEHSAALFSHGMCPKCMDQLYGDQDWYKKRFKTK